MEINDHQGLRMSLKGRLPMEHSTCGAWPVWHGLRNRVVLQFPLVARLHPSLHDALAKNNVHDSNRLTHQINPFRHLKQQRKHHSIRASHQAI